MENRGARLIGRFRDLAFTVLIAGVLAGALARVSPGFDTDERELDPRLDEASRQSIRAERNANRDLWPFYARYFRSLLRGDLGTSEAFHLPIGELIRQRAPVTAEIMSIGIAGGWALAFALAIPAAACRRPIAAGLGATLAGVLMCVPAAALALVVFAFGGPVRGIVALVIFPRVFDYVRNLLQHAYAQPYILTARAKGIGAARILLRHVLPPAAPQLLALAGASAAMAFGAAIPVETLCDLPGIGQLAWKAALARDLPLLVVLTAMIALLTELCNSLPDLILMGAESHRAEAQLT